MRWLLVATAMSLAGVAAPLSSQAPMRALSRSGVSRVVRTALLENDSATTSRLDRCSLVPGACHATYATRDAWWAPIASAIVPGTGQLILRQDRAIAYFALEAFVAAQYARDRHEARRQRDAYRELARTVARALFDTGTLPDGNFEYYERMEKYTESGVYDLVPGGDVDPEDDETTFNGAVWRLARETFWQDHSVPPAFDSFEYRRALAFYLGRAVRPEFRWSWRNAQLEQDLFVRTIDASNGAFRRTIGDLGALLANHALSTVDAYITVRLRWRANAPPAMQPGRETASIEASLPWAPFGRR